MKAKDFKKFMKKYWLIFSLVLVLMSSIAIVVWARYVDANNSMKRTIVSTAETQEKRFTSNLLIRTDPNGSPSPKTDPVSESSKITYNGQNYYKVQVIIRNYTAYDTTHFYDEDIEYDFTAELTDVGGRPITDTGKVSLVKYYDDDNNVRSFELSGGKYIRPMDTVTLSKSSEGIHDKTYTFIFHESLLSASDNVFIKMKAEPKVTSIKLDVKTLQGIIGISTQATEIVQTWTGSFSDEGAAAVNGTHAVSVGSYDGFNYTIQGSGKRTVSLTWDNTKLELNPFSQSDLKSVSDSIGSAWDVRSSGNYTTIIFAVDSEITPRYDIQFYMKGVEISSWEELDVTFNANVSA